MKKIMYLLGLFCLLLAFSTTSFAGKPKTGDISINSDVEEVNTIAAGGAKAETNVHSVEVSEGKTGDIEIKGKAKRVNTIAAGGAKAETNVGSVKVGQ